MNYRVAKILAAEDIGAAGTKVIDINIADVISRIDIIFRTLNGDHGFDDHPAANITKIELVDGSDVLFSLNGRETQALNFYNRRQTPDNRLTGSMAEWMRAIFGLDFGRYLFDPTLAFDPTKFTNPQLKITWDQDVANTSCVANFLTVQAHLFDEKKPTPTGFLMSKNVYTYTPTANAYEYLDLPTDHPIRTLLVGAHQEERVFGQMIAEIRLSEDNDKRIPVDLTSDELMYLIRETYPEYIENVYMYVDTSDTYFRVTPSDDAVLIPNSVVVLQDVYALFLNGGKARAKTADSIATIYMISKGYIPHGLAPLPIGNPDEVDDWYDVTKVGTLQIRIKAGATPGTTPLNQIVTQQYRAYA